MRLISVEARLSEELARDLAGVAGLTAAAEESWPEGVKHSITSPGGPSTERIDRGVDGWRRALAECAPILAEAADAVREALRAGDRPLTLATDCAVAIATIPAVQSVLPEAHVLWLDAHFDSGLPAERSHWLGGMALSGALGDWDTGFAPPIDPRRVVLLGPRTHPRGEPYTPPRDAVRLLPGTPAGIAEALDALAGETVYVHFDPDILDPADYRGQWPEPDGPALEEMANAFAILAGAATVCGVEVTAFHAPVDAVARRELSRRLIAAVAPAFTDTTTAAR